MQYYISHPVRNFFSLKMFHDDSFFFDLPYCSRDAPALPHTPIHTYMYQYITTRPIIIEHYCHYTATQYSVVPLPTDYYLLQRKQVMLNKTVDISTKETFFDVRQCDVTLK
jgi:hypothetical protein